MIGLIQMPKLTLYANRSNTLKLVVADLLLQLDLPSVLLRSNQLVV
jgi:hypothetical protein